MGARCGANDVIKMLRAFPGWVSAMHMHVRAATVLLLLWPIKMPLPVSSTAILMRHPRLQQEGKNRRMGENGKERKGLIEHRVHMQQS